MSEQTLQTADSDTSSIEFELPDWPGSFGLCSRFHDDGLKIWVEDSDGVAAVPISEAHQIELIKFLCKRNKLQLPLNL